MQASLSGGLDMNSPEATLLGMSKSKLDLLQQRPYSGFAFSQEAGNARALKEIVFNPKDPNLDSWQEL